MGKPNLLDEIAATEARLAELKRRAVGASCVELGHDWKSTGGKNASCHEECGCSVPVNVCTRCGDCDYGDNADADAVRKECCDMGHGPLER